MRAPPAVAVLVSALAAGPSCKDKPPARGTPQPVPSAPTSGGEEAPAREGGRPHADILLVGGKVRTLDPKRPLASSLAIKDGRIAAVGDKDELDPWIGPTTKVIGIEGKTVVPGLADGHMHLEGLGARRSKIDLVGAATLEEAKARVAAAVRSAKPGQWLEGRGWDQNDWSDLKKGRWPTAKDLDAVAPDNPVVLVRIDGHALWANTRAIEIAAITSATRSPAGGQIVQEGKKPAGVFIDNAMALVEGRSPPPSRVDLRKAFLLGQNDCLTAGLTQVHDMGVGPAELAILKELDDAGDLVLRVYAMLDGSVEDLAGLMADGPYQGKRLTVRGVKFYVDGALGSRGALLFEAYSDDPKSRGLAVMDEQLFGARVRSAKARGFQVATHAIGDLGNRIVLDTYDAVFKKDGGDARPRVEHAQLLHPDDIPRFAARGVIASMQPTHATSDMPWAEARVGPSRIKGAYAWRSLISASATVAAGSDAPVEDISPFAGLYAAITRTDASGQPPGGWMPQEKMTRNQALAAFTHANAVASFREHEAGRIEQGWVADVTVIDVDPLEDPPQKILKGRAELTIIGGQIAYARPGADRGPLPKAPDAAPRVATSTAVKSHSFEP